MKICILFLLLMTVQSHATLAKEQEEDDLEPKLAIAKEDTNKVLLLHQLAWKYLSSDLAKTNNYIQQGLRLSRKLGFRHGEIILLNRLGDYYSHQGDYVKSIEYTTQSLKIAEQTKDELGIADAYTMLGIIYKEGLKQSKIALHYHLKALEIYKKLKLNNGIAANYNLIARIYAATNQKLDTAHLYTDRAISIAKKLGNEDFLAWCLSTKGMVYDDTGELDSAIVYIQLASESYKKVNNKINVVVNAILVGNIYLKKGNMAMGIHSFQKQIPAIKELNAKGLLRDVYGGLSKGYRLQKQYDSAYIYYEQYENLKDSLLNSETSQKIASIQEVYEIEKKEIEIALLEKEKQINTIIFTVSFSALLLVLLLILRNSQQKRKTNRLLKAKNEEIATQNEELKQSKEEIAQQRDVVTEQNFKLQQINATKDKFFSIISHDLRSPIGSLRNLLDLIVHGHILPEEYGLFFPKLRSSVINIQDTLDNLLHWSYSQMDGIKSSPIHLTINTLIKDNMLLFTEVAKEKKISMESNLSTTFAIFADENQVRLILRNILSNAIKFTPFNGMITISAKHVEDDFLEVSIKDTGVGMTQSQLDTIFGINSVSTKGTNNEKGTGLGLKLCKEMIENNNGKIRVESELGKGSTFILLFPTKDLGNFLPQ